MLLTFLNNYWMKKYYRVFKSFTDILNGFSYNGNCSNGNRNFDLVFNYIIVMLTADKLSMLKKCLYTSFVNSIDFKSDYEDYGTPILHCTNYTSVHVLSKQCKTGQGFPLC